MEAWNAWIAAVETWQPIVALRGSTWAYPLVSWLHLLGIGLLFGTIAVVDLRLAGGLLRLDDAALQRTLVPLSLAGFVLAALSGLLLFAPAARGVSVEPVVRRQAGADRCRGPERAGAASGLAPAPASDPGPAPNLPPWAAGWSAVAGAVGDGDAGGEDAGVRISWGALSPTLSRKRERESARRQRDPPRSPAGATMATPCCPLPLAG
ncbi:hypothetical protein [Cupriavidus sp. H18C1]|uniref:hypothetical protein n=1 Tax=Cupriavidus sp. H18C1 TaxID=3241601 RepID=UPI003BB94E4E